VFRVFADRDMRPGDSLGPEVLFHAVGRSGAVVADGIKALEDLGYVQVAQNQTSIILTDDGYEAIRNGATV
jgi:hypothetical protein